MSDQIKEIEALRKQFIATYFSKQQVCMLLDITPKTLETWLKQGYGPPAYKASNGRVYYKISEVRKWTLQQPSLVDKFAAEDARNQAATKKTKTTA